MNKTEKIIQMIFVANYDSPVIVPDVVIAPLVLIAVVPEMVPAFIAEPDTAPAVVKVGISDCSKGDVETTRP